MTRVVWGHDQASSTLAARTNGAKGCDFCPTCYLVRVAPGSGTAGPAPGQTTKDKAKRHVQAKKKGRVITLKV